MSISLTRYVDITSGIGNSAVVPTRDLIARIFTANNLLPPQSFVSFTDAASVGSYFGLSSEEYLRAVFYFSWISKNLTQPQAIQFARWVQAAVAPMIFPVKNGGTVLANWTSITSGSFVLTMGGFTFTLASLDFSAAASLADVATVIEMAIQSETGGGALWTAATVTYSAAYGGFLLVGGATGNAVISVQVGGGGTNITPAGLLGWLPAASDINGNFVAGAIYAPGSAIETITQTLTASATASNNFGSFAFMTNLGITQQNMVDAATWNNAENVLYMYSQAVLPANITAWQAAVASIGGVGLTVSPNIINTITGTVTSGSNVVSGMTSNNGITIGMPVTGTDIAAGTIVTSLVSTTGLTLSLNATGSDTELLSFYTLQFPEMFPMMIEAATNYDSINSVQNYEFQQVAGLTASVSDDSTANAYDSVNVNYYGMTQQAGQQIAFYQQGKLQGIAPNIIDMNAYVNEIWLKDAASAAIMSLLLSVNQIPANAQGRNQVLAVLQGVINQALNNGTISVGKTLTTAQQMYITSATGDNLAWHQVQNNGYWVDVVITLVGSNYQATYTLIYSKDDVIRKVTGTNTLI
jgi:hypothetical protein